MNHTCDIAVSVIIPVYNLEDYIETCIESIIKQTIKNIELILVDDCSADNSAQILERYLQNTTISRIVVLKNDTNMGAGYSRNRGLEIAKGKYLLFLDGDDFFEPDMIEKLYLQGEKTCADVVMCDFWVFDNATGENKVFDESTNYPMTEIAEKFKLSDIYMYAFQYIHEIAWNKMFRRTFVIDNNLQFQCQHNANDQFFVFQCMLRAKIITRVSESLLHYRTNIKNQLSVSISKSPLCIWNATIATLNYMKALGMYSVYKKSFNTYMVNRLFFSLSRVNEIERKNVLDFYYREGLQKLQLDKCTYNDFTTPYYFGKWKQLIENGQENEPVVRKLPFENDKWELLYQKLQDIENLVLWGIGINGEKFLEKMNAKGIRLRCIVDRDKEKRGKQVAGYTVQATQCIKNDDFIIVLNPEHIIMIQNQMKQNEKKVQIADVRAYICYDIEWEQTIIES